MAARAKARRIKRSTTPKQKIGKRAQKSNKSGLIIRRRHSGISNARLERGLRVLRDGSDLSDAARAINVSPERFKRAALKKRAIRKRGRYWRVAGSLPWRMLIFSGGKQFAVTVRGRKSTSLIGGYMSAVRQFLRTNKPDALTPFVDRGIKDAAGKSHQFETNPNELYRLSSAGDQTFEQIYKIVI